MQRPEPRNEEIELDNTKYIESETDTKGIITDANDYFCEISGYTRDELIGQPHNIVRHPDMPKAAFAKMWETIKRGEMWEGYVKNMRKDGRYYWVIVWIKPKFDNDGNIVGYIAGRKVPDRQMIKTVEKDYRAMLEQEK